MCGVVVHVSDPPTVVAALPGAKLALQSEGKTSFDKLHHLFQRDIRGRCQEEMDVVRHYNEGVKVKTIFDSLFFKDFEE